MTDKKTLSNKAQLFVNEYILDFNALQAAKRAGYSKKTAYQIGFLNLSKPGIQAAIAKAMLKRNKRTEINADWVVKKLVTVVERCMEGVAVLDKKTGLAIRYEFNASGANKALELLGRHTGGFDISQKIELSGDLAIKRINLPHKKSLKDYDSAKQEISN